MPNKCSHCGRRWFVKICKDGLCQRCSDEMAKIPTCKECGEKVEHWIVDCSDYEGLCSKCFARKKEPVEKTVLWTDEVKSLETNGDIKGALEASFEALPVPAAFKRAAIILRKIIRAKRKNREDYDATLGLLYDLAVKENFLYQTPYIKNIQTGVDAIVWVTPDDVWKSLSYEYKTIGYNKLPLLNKTDAKWILERWGEPEQHINAQHHFSEIWNFCVKQYVKIKKKESDDWKKELSSMLKPKKGGYY